MDEFVRAAGFKDLATQKRKMSSIIKSAAENTEARRKQYASDDNKSTECFRYCGKNFGLTTYNLRSNEDIFKMKRWEAFAESEYDILLNSIFIDKGKDGQLYAFCEEEHTGSEFEFRLNNVLEYKKKWRECPNDGAPCKANVAGLASYGTVILPVEKNEESKTLRDAEDREYKELLARVRKGDECAEDIINERAFEMSLSIRERLKTEDLLSVFEGYMLPVGDEDGVFAVLGEIVSFETDINDITGENVLRMTLEITGAVLSVFINEGDLLGMPMKGMRFMGVCKLQGSIIF